MLSFELAGQGGYRVELASLLKRGSSWTGSHRVFTAASSAAGSNRITAVAQSSRLPDSGQRIKNWDTPGAQAYVRVTVNIPEEETASALLAFLRRPSGIFARANTRADGDCVTGSLDGDVWVKILLLDDGLLHVVVEPRAVIVM